MSLQATQIMADSIVVDMTAPGSPLDFITPSHEMTDEWVSSYEKGGCTLASFSLGADHHAETIEACITAISKARNWFLAQPERFLIVDSTQDVRRAKSDGKLGVMFNFQGTMQFQRNIKLIEVYRRLGVTHALMAYNTKNLVGDGCHERTDSGLSSFGLEVIAEMNRVGMLVDVTHTGYRTSMETMEVSSAPVIMSHSSPMGVYNHPRNVADDQIIALAKTGGVMGIHGVGLFMSKSGDQVSAEDVASFVRYAVDLVGPQHVGFGLDYVMFTDVLLGFVAGNRSKYKKEDGYDFQEVHFATPSVMGEVAEILLRENYSEEDVKGILGENWMRVFEQVCG